MATFSDFMSGLGKGAEELASEIAGSNYIKTIFPGMAELEKEFAETIAGSKKLMGKKLDIYAQNTVQDNLNKMSSKLNIPENVVNELKNGIHADTLDSDIDNLAKELSKYTDKSDKVAEILKKNAHSAVESHIGDSSTLALSAGEKITKYPQAYFSHPDKKIRNTRIATAVGAYAGVAVGGRYLSGGTLTTDQYGRKDIAGVPFL